jgi:hypothetical protein
LIPELVLAAPLEAEAVTLLPLFWSAFYLGFYIVRGRSTALTMGLALIFGVSGFA